MSADIIDLAAHRKEELVWRCDCGTISFILHSDGRIQCCGCDAIQHTGNARWVPQQPREADVTAFPGATTCVDQEF